jgi:hypothetical protein
MYGSVNLLLRIAKAKQCRPGSTACSYSSNDSHYRREIHHNTVTLTIEHISENKEILPKELVIK